MKRTMTRIACLTAVASAAGASSAPAQTTAEPRAVPAAQTTSVGVDYGLDYFTNDLDPWHLASLSVARRGALGSIIGRVNAARRFGRSGAQVEADAYPRLGEHTYAYLNAGYSGSAIFPDLRFGAELYANLPDAWEASAGVRQLRFGGAPVTLLTGTVGRYVRNAWISVRPTVRHRDDGYSASASVTARQYFADADNYVGARVGVGSAPSDRLTPNEAATREQSWSASLQGSRTLRPRTTLTGSLGTESETLRAGAKRNRVTANVGLRFDVGRAGGRADAR